MKKLMMSVCVCMALSACTPFEADLDRATTTRMSHIAAERREIGCQAIDDHAAYRECVMKTYYANKPKTYKTVVDDDGKSIAVVKNTVTNSYDEEKDVYKTERVVVIESEEKLVPIPLPKAEETNPVLDDPCDIEEDVILETQPTPEKEVVKKEQKKVEDVASVKEKKKAPKTSLAKDKKKEDVIAYSEPAQPDSWWKNYKKNKKSKVNDEVKCPCDDPNEPCPQCFDK